MSFQVNHSQDASQISRRQLLGLLGGCCLLPERGSASDETHVLSVRNEGLLFTDNRAGVSGVDCGYSVSLPHSTLWLFGDVFLQNPNSVLQPYVGGVSNCGLLAPHGSGAEPLKKYRFITGKNGIARQLIEPGAQHKRYWPLGGWYSMHAKKLFLFYSRIRVTGHGMLDFVQEGTGLCEADADHAMHMQPAIMPSGSGHTLWWESNVTYGQAVIYGTKGPWVYAAGMRDTGGMHTCTLMRLPEAAPTLAGCEYYAGGKTKPRWSRNPGDAVEVQGISNFPGELSISYNHYLGRYLALHTIGLSQKVQISLAEHPWGPYQPFAVVGARHRLFSKALCYAAKEHPELAEQNGKAIYFTFVDSERYWLQLQRVEFS